MKLRWKMFRNRPIPVEINWKSAHKYSSLRWTIIKTNILGTCPKIVTSWKTSLERSRSCSYVPQSIFYSIDMEICDLCDWCYVMIFQKGSDIKFSFQSKTILIKHFMFSLIIRNEKLWWKFWQKLLFVESKIKPSNICNWFLVSTLPVMGYLHWSLRKFAVRTNYCS